MSNSPIVEVPTSGPAIGPAAPIIRSNRANNLRAHAVYALTAIVGVIAFAWPFWIPGDQLDSVNNAHAGDAWIWATLLGALTVAALLVETAQRRMNGATIATLGVLASMNGLLRLIDLPGAGSAMFFFTVVAGAALGTRFGALLGLTAMAASAVITAGIGPWLPYQMLGLAAMGAGAGIVGSAVRTQSMRVQLGAIATFGWGAQFVYGGLLNLWFWPLVRDGGALSYASGLGFNETVHRYWSYYAASSFAWDAAGAAVNLMLILLLGAPMLRSLRRISYRLNPSTVWL